MTSFSSSSLSSTFKNHGTRILLAFAVLVFTVIVFSTSISISDHHDDHADEEIARMILELAKKNLTSPIKSAKNEAKQNPSIQIQTPTTTQVVEEEEDNETTTTITANVATSSSLVSMTQNNGKNDRNLKNMLQQYYGDFHPRFYKYFPSDVRTHEYFMGTLISSSDLVFNDFSTFCNTGVGTVRCSPKRLSLTAKSDLNNKDNNKDNDNHRSKASSSSSCCCSWTPISRTCVSPLNQSNRMLMWKILFSHLVHSPTSNSLPQLKQLSKIACVWHDNGQWNLPENFLDLDFHEAAKAIVKASSFSSSTRKNSSDFFVSDANNTEDAEFAAAIETEKKYRKNIGPLLVWKLGKEMRRLNPHKLRITKHFKIKNATTESFARNTTHNETNSSSSTIFSSPGMIVISGDSIVRHIFTRLIHAIRSRECKDENEMFRGGVFERYYHLSAGYVVTTKGDALSLEFDKGCERIAREKYTSSLVPGGGRVLLRICYVWENRGDVSNQGGLTGEDNRERGTEDALARISKFTKISAVIYSPTIHHCTMNASKKCPTPDAAVRAVQKIFNYSKILNIPRVVILSSMNRNWYPGFHNESIRLRNEALKKLFSVNFWKNNVETQVDFERISKHWKLSKTRREIWRKAYDEGMALAATKVKINYTKISVHENFDDFWMIPDDNPYSPLSPHETESEEEKLKLFLATKDLRFRFYDFGTRHRQITPRQCDHGHSMCMVWPLRVHNGKSAQMIDGVSGLCPNGSRCEDPWNFLLMHEIVALLLA